MAVDLEIDGTQPSCSPRRRERAGARGTAGEATCRRRASAARVVVDGGGLGLRLGGVMLAGSGRVVGGEQHGRGAVNELRRALLVAPGYETEGKRGRVSAVS